MTDLWEGFYCRKEKSTRKDGRRRSRRPDKTDRRRKLEICLVRVRLDWVFLEREVGGSIWKRLFREILQKVKIVGITLDSCILRMLTDYLEKFIKLSLIFNHLNIIFTH